MTAKEAAQYINRPVRYAGRMQEITKDYILTGITTRRNEHGFYFQAELKDTETNSIIIVKVEDVQAAL